jgi:hypothetical protein
MRNYMVKTKVAKDFNDNKTGNKYEENEPITLERARYEELLSKGFVKIGEEVKENPKTFEKTIKISKKEDE